MLRAVSVKPAGDWTGKPMDVVILDSIDRTILSKDARVFTTVGGKIIELPAKNLLPVRTGDAYLVEDGGIVEIIGKPEPLTEIRSDNEQSLINVAWQLGKHNLALQIVGKKIRVRRNKELATVLNGISVKMTDIEAPFDPEGLDYLAQTKSEHIHDHACGCGHHHGHHHDHDDLHGANHDHHKHHHKHD